MTPVLAASHLHFAYPRADVAAIADVSLALSAGELLAVHGPSGCGKSTLLYLLGLFLTPTTGEIMFDGASAAGLDDRARSRLRAHHIGFVFQDAALLQSETLLDNIVEAGLYSGLSRGESMAEARRLATAMGLEQVAARRPNQVSGGQAQRAALCRALVRHPKLILADEPTGNLDPATAESVVATLRQAATDGVAVVVVTHAPDVIRACDRAERLA